MECILLYIFKKYYKKFYENFLIMTFRGPVTLLAGRSFSFAHRIPLKFKKRSGTGHFHSAGRTLPTPILKQKSIIINLFLTLYLENVNIVKNLICIFKLILLL